MKYLQMIQGWGERAPNCLLVSLVQYAEHEICKNIPETEDILIDIELCITKLAKLIALGELYFDVDLLKHYLLRVSHFSVGLNQALLSHQSGGLAFVLGEISHYLFVINFCKDTIPPPDLTTKDIELLSQAAHFVLSHACPELVNTNTPADMEWIKKNFWDDARDLLILRDVFHELARIGSR
jgi:hypothetical protein